MNATAFVIPDFRGGGAERVFVTLVNYLSKKNINVILIVGHKRGPLLKELDNKVEVVELKSSGIRSLIKLRRIIKERELKAVVGTLSMAYVVALLKLFIPKSCKMISRLGNTISADLDNHKGIRKLFQRLYQYVLILSDSIIVQSESMRDDLYTLLPYNRIKRMTTLIYNPIEILRVKENAHSEDISDLVSSCDIVCVGRLERQKDHATTIYAFNNYQKVKTNSKLHILGDGKLMNQLKDLVEELNLSDKIIFHGHVENPYTLILKSRMLIMSSLYEGFSNVILESICLHTPVVASDCPGGNSEIITDGVNGFLFKTGCYLDMSEKMIKATNHTFTDFSVLSYSVDKIADKYLDAFNV